MTTIHTVKDGVIISSGECGKLHQNPEVVIFSNKALNADEVKEIANVEVKTVHQTKTFDCDGNMDNPEYYTYYINKTNISG